MKRQEYCATVYSSHELADFNLLLLLFICKNFVLLKTILIAHTSTMT